MFDRIGRVKLLALATLWAAAAGCSSPSEYSMGRHDDDLHDPGRLLAIAEVFEKQGHYDRAGELYVYVQKSSPELSREAKDHLRLMAARIARDGQDPEDRQIARRGEPKARRAPAAVAKVVAERPRQKPPEKTRDSAERRQLDLANYRQPPSRSRARQEQIEAAADQRRAEIAAADEQGDIAAEEMPAEEEEEGAPPIITEGEEDVDEDTIPSIEEVVGELSSDDSDRRLATALQIVRLGLDVRPIVRSLHESLQQEESELVRVQLADAMLLIAPHDIEAVRVLQRAERSKDPTAAALARELMESLSDEEDDTEMAASGQDDGSPAQVAARPSPAVHPEAEAEDFRAARKAVEGDVSDEDLNEYSESGVIMSSWSTRGD
jgi:hypothetical protein